MKRFFYFTLLALVVIIIISSCKKSGLDNGSDLTGQVNLITNPSFEINGQKTLIGWYPSMTIFFVNDVPTGGGNWAIWMGGGNFTGNIFTAVPAQSGTHEYYLSIYGKESKQEEGNGFSRVQLILKHANDLFFLKYLSIKDTTWTLYSLQDTLTASTNDTLIVKIINYPMEYSYHSLFDLCTLKKMN
jgi:hypothetical protein